MPKNKRYMDRLIALHQKLSSGQHYTFEELRLDCESKTDQVIAERTLYNDLGELRELGAPIPNRNRSGRPYYYEKPFSLFGLLNPTDAALANEAVALIRQMQTLPQFAGLESVMLRFEQQAGVIGKPQQSVVQFEQNQRYKGLSWLPGLYKAIQDDKLVRIDYTEFGEPPVRYQVSPYLLKEFNNRWYVYGWIAELNGIRNLALDRIDGVKPYADLRRRPDHTDWDHYLADVVGVTYLANQPVETAVLRVWLKRALYVDTKPIHSTQTVIHRTDDYLDFQYQLIWNNEFDAKILELGADAELLAPVAHRMRLAGVVRRMGERYER